MAEQCFFFDSTEGNEREYAQDELSKALKHATAANGISPLAYQTPLAADLQPDGSVVVQPGVMAIEGFWYENDAPLRLVPEGFLQGQPRTDWVIVRLDKALNAQTIRAQMLRGADGSSLPPPLLREGNSYDLGLAQIVFNGATAALLDTRADRAVCGYIGQQYAAAADLAALRTDMGVPAGATVLAVAHGGTGGSSPAQARANLGALHKAGDTMTGPLTLAADPTEGLGAATKKYVDTAVTAGDAALKAGDVAAAHKLATARKIGLSGGATGTATPFDGTGDVTIPVTALDVSKASAGVLPVARGGTGSATQGSGSGFDADKLDGYDASYFAKYVDMTTTKEELALVQEIATNALPKANVANNLTTAASGHALDARQGTTLKANMPAAVRLWSGTWTSGSITVPNIGLYTVIAVVDGASAGIGFINNGFVRIVFGNANISLAFQEIATLSLAVSTNTLTYSRSMTMQHTANGTHGAGSAQGITEIWGLMSTWIEPK